jgi:uncharacterized membrane protein (UPF0127 family)
LVRQSQAVGVNSVTVARTGAILAGDLKSARGVVARVRGLMLAQELRPGDGLDIRPCNSIHMMFMRFSIDAVFYDRDATVTRVSSRLRPWTGIAFGGRGAKGVLELPAGAAADIRIGDRLEFETTEGGSHAGTEGQSKEANANG